MSKPDINVCLRALADALPLHVEEGATREIASESQLCAQVAKRTGEEGTAAAVVATVRRVFSALRLLEPIGMRRGEWVFVSFPASLLARSILETLATDQQGVFDVDYWTQGTHRPKAIIEQQRALLRELERYRQVTHPNHAANPIRTVHVACALIKLGGRFLLHRREDEYRPEVKGYVLPGGRLTLDDLPEAKRDAAVLRELLKADCALAREALPKTLARELKDELGLLPGEFDATVLRSLKPYCAVEGPRNNHVYSLYDMAICQVQLSREGELKVLARAADEPGEFAWFSATDLVATKRPDGTSAFVDALLEDLGPRALPYLRDQVRDSSTVLPVYRDDTHAVELPMTQGQPLLVGKTGREKEFPFVPTADEWELLMLLGWSARGLPVEPGDHLQVLGAGWIRATNRTLQNRMERLAMRMAQAGFPIVELESRGFGRLSIDPAHVYFNAGLFDYVWRTEERKKYIVVTLKPIHTDLAMLGGTERRIRLAPQFNRDIVAVMKGLEPKSPAFDRTLREHFRITREIGLRRFAAEAKDTWEIAVPAREES